MKKLVHATLLLILTGLASGFQTPQTSPTEDVGIDLPNYFETAERPDVELGFDSDLRHSYESDLVDFNTSESVEANLTGLENISEAEQGISNSDNKTKEEPRQNETENSERSDSIVSSSSGGGEYSVSNIEVEMNEENSSNNGTQPAQNTSQSNDESEKTEQRTRPGIFDGPWTEKGESKPSLQQRLTGRFSDSKTLGGITLVVFGGLAAYSYM